MLSTWFDPAPSTATGAPVQVIVSDLLEMRSGDASAMVLPAIGVQSSVSPSLAAAISKGSDPGDAVPIFVISVVAAAERRAVPSKIAPQNSEIDAQRRNPELGWRSDMTEHPGESEQTAKTVLKAKGYAAGG